ncbi:MAG TPA: archaemetzincin family Zn-dependent metalloprotease [Bacteroidales bacterium]|nr:archaemetzincin family Zn-dependent metalloprotease [Bacteroidales bacterium]
MEERRIILTSFGIFEKDLLDRLAISVTNEYHQPVSLVESHFDLNPFYSPGRRQYDANQLLKHISSYGPPEPAKTLGLFRVDLFIPVLTYIFGQAMLGGNTGIASVYRLKNELYGMKKDDGLMAERFSKEVIHELGHTFGLIHCHVSTCVMRSSTYVEDIDQKSLHLCSKCQSEAGI